MPKINREEYEMLKGLDERWKWIARDKNNTLVMGAGKNERYLDGWFPPENIGDSLVADEINAVKVISEWGNLFQFIQWEDEDPYNIAELIEEYERESEETEVKKDIEWLKDILFDENVIRLFPNDIEKLHELINQLDEPEVLSQEWIEENKEDSGVHYIGYYVPIGRLHDLLVPKQELPVIPKFVAEWIEEYIEYGYDLYPALKKMENNSRAWKKTYEWYRKNTRKFVNAYLTGKYEVEEQQRYYLKIGNLYLAEPLGDMTSDIVRMTRDKGVAYQFTDEKSIATHLDKFEGTEAVKVEEVKE